MHWLIPSVSHALSGLVAWFGDSLSLTALLVSCGLAASQSIHLWAIFYGFFAVYFLSGTCITGVSRLLSRNTSNSARPRPSLPATRTAANLVANVLVAAALVPLHQYYMKQRLQTVPWFHILRAPAGCLPVPSRTLDRNENAKDYEFVDALGNQLPFGILVSYAVAMANLFSSSLGAKPAGNRSGGGRIFAGMIGALLLALLAAYGMPLCDDNLEGSHEVMMHVDRSTAHEERTNMTWSWEARYVHLVGWTTLIGTASAAIVDRLVGPKSSASEARTKAVRSTHPVDSKTTASSPSEKSGNPGSGQAQEKSDTSRGSRVTRNDLVSLGVNLVVTSAVVLGMAGWSYMYFE